MARLDREKTPLGETAILSLVFPGEISDAQVRPEIAPLPGVDIVYRGSKPTVMVWQGKVAVGTEFIYHLVPKTVGRWEISPIRLLFNGREFRSDPLQLEAVEGMVPPASERIFTPQGKETSTTTGKEIPSPEVEPKAFLEVDVSHERPFVREPFLVTHRIFCNVSFRFKSFKRPPGGAEFVQMEKLAHSPDEAHQEEREINGEHYVGEVVSETIWFSKEAGERSFDPGEILLLVKRHSKKLFDRSYQEAPPAGDFFASSEEKTVTLSPLTVSVRPLPESQKPEAFGGAVGQFQMEASLDKQEAEVGQSVALKVVLKGTGNLEGIKNLSLGRLPFASSYASRGSEEVKREKEKVHAQKSFEFVLIPNQAGSYTLEEIPFWYFNPRLGAYRKTSSQPLSLLIKEQVAAQGGGAPAPGPSQQEPALLGKDIYFIKTDLGNIRRRQGPYYKHPVFIPLHLSPLFLLMMSGIFRAYQIYIGHQELPRRQRRALKVSYGRLEEARRFLNQGDPQGYAREAEAALFGYFEDKLNQPTKGLTIDALQTVVTQAGGDPALLGSFRRCLEALHAIRFASGSVSSQEVLASYTLCRDLIADLDELDFSKLKKT